MSYNNKKFLDANGVTQIVGLLDDYATNETLSTVVNSVQTALDQKVDDVQINETSILNNRVANIPIAGSNVLGVVKTKGSFGLVVSNDGSIKIAHAGEEAIKGATIYPNPIIPSTQHISTFYGLSKAAGVDLANETVTFGVYPETSKTAIRTMLGAVGLTDYANQNTGGVVKIIENGSGGFQMSSGYLLIKPATIANAKSGTNGTLAPLVPGLQDASTFYGLAKAAGYDEKDSSEPLGTYTDGAKEAIQKMLGFEDILGNYESSSTASKAYTVGETFIFNGKRYRATANIAQNYVITPGTNCELAPISLSDIQINGISILNNGVANIPFAGSSTLGVVKVSDRSEGLMMNSTNGLITIAPAGNYAIKMGTSSFNPIVPDKQHLSVFYGLATAAGDITQSASDNTVGTYTTTAAAAIKTMLQIQEGLKVVRLI